MQRAPQGFDVQLRLQAFAERLVARSLGDRCVDRHQGPPGGPSQHLTHAGPLEVVEVAHLAPERVVFFS
jgi:hypothetical protein